MRLNYTWNIWLFSAGHGPSFETWPAAETWPADSTSDHPTPQIKNSEMMHGVIADKRPARGGVQCFWQ